VAPYETVWDANSAPAGSHTVTAEARDAANNVATAAVVVDVTPAGPHYVSLDGVNDYVGVADADDLSFGNGGSDQPFTIELWVQPSSLAGRHKLVSKWVEGPRNIPCTWPAGRCN